MYTKDKLNRMTKKELREICDEMKIENVHKKKHMIETIIFLGQPKVECIICYENGIFGKSCDKYSNL